MRHHSLKLIQPPRVARRQRVVQRIAVAVIDAAVMLVAVTRPGGIGIDRRRYVTVLGIVRVVVPVGRVVVPVRMRVVVVLTAVHVQTPLGQPYASQGKWTDAQP